jgi:hypothetical protein
LRKASGALAVLKGQSVGLGYDPLVFDLRRSGELPL